MMFVQVFKAVEESALKQCRPSGLPDAAGLKASTTTVSGMGPG